MTDSHRKRKWAGPPVRELRKADQEPAHVPPHKKPRDYKLTVRFTTTATRVHTASFPSKRARDDFRRKVEQDMKNRNEYALWRFMGAVQKKETRGPEFEESLNDMVTSPFPTTAEPK